MLKVIVDENQTRNLRIREGEKNGRKWRMASQKVWVYKPGASFPEQFEINLPDGAFAYQPGEYQLDFEQLLTRGQFDAMALDTRNGVLLIPGNVSETGTVSTEIPAANGTASKNPLFNQKAATAPVN